MPESQIRLNPDCRAPVRRIDCPDDIKSLATPEFQREMRDLYHAPGLVIVDDAIDASWIEDLRVALSDKSRPFMSAFIDGEIPTSAAFNDSWKRVRKRIKRIADALFGYELKPEGLAHSFRNMVTENEPLHFDTYAVACGEFPLMGVTNFDRQARVWHVGPNFRNACGEDADYVARLLQGIKPGESPALRMRKAGMNDEGPLRAATPVHEIRFAPGSVWFANPKALAHQVVYGNGAIFCQWDIADPERPCGCQHCVIEALGIPVEGLRADATAS